jgi:hypothetical protein
MWVWPGTAASILAYREEQTAGVMELLKRSFDYKRIRTKIWYVPHHSFADGLDVWTDALDGVAASSPAIPVSAGSGDVFAFFVAGLGEKLGWSGYVIDPMQARWNALEASSPLGMVWAVWHWLPLMQARRSPP